MLVKSKLVQLREELSNLDRQISKPSSKELEHLKIFVHLKLQEAEILSVAMDHLASTSEAPNRPNLDDMFRQLKNDARTAFVRWRRFRANQGRLDKKRQRKKAKEQAAP